MMKKRTLAALLSLALCCTSAAAMAKTETLNGFTLSSETGDWASSGISQTINKAGTYILTGTGTNNANYISVADVGGDVTLVLDNLNFDLYNSGMVSAIQINNSGYTKIILRGNTVLRAGYGHAAIETNSSGTVEITCEGCSNPGHTCGSLVAEGGTYSPGIGGGSVPWLPDYTPKAKKLIISGGRITSIGGEINSTGLGGLGENGIIEIRGGQIEATGNSGAGIGGNVKQILISGGNVIANGNNTYAAIGSSYEGTVQDIIISGGTITTSGIIGSGYKGTVDNITISGGTVHASFKYGTAIGASSQSSVDSISITGGEITASSSVGIGGGNNSSVSSIAISGGIIRATGSSSGVAIGSDSSGSIGSITISGGSIEAKGGSRSSAISTGKGGSSSNIVIAPEKHRITASVSTTGFTDMDELEGSPFTEGSTDVTDQVSGFQYFKTIGQKISEGGEGPGSAQPIEPDTTLLDSMPQTGDSANLALWSCLLALSGALLAIMKRHCA